MVTSDTAAPLAPVIDLRLFARYRSVAAIRFMADLGALPIEPAEDAAVDTYEWNARIVREGMERDERDLRRAFDHAERRPRTKVTCWLTPEAITFLEERGWTLKIVRPMDWHSGPPSERPVRRGTRKKAPRYDGAPRRGHFASVRIVAAPAPVEEGRASS